jgi:hypothetical protein
MSSGRILVLGLSFASLSVVTAACGSDDEPTSDQPDGAEAGASSGGPSSSGSSGTARAPVPKEQFLEQLANSLCEGLEACCNNAGYPYEPGACAALLASDAGTNPDSVGALTDPTITYDPVAAAACVAAARAGNALCAVPSMADRAEAARAQSQALAAFLADPSLLASCNRVFSGTKQVGEPCALGECALPPGDAQVSCAPLPNAPNDAAPVCQIFTYVTQAGAPCDDPTERGATFRFCTAPPEVTATVPQTDAEYTQMLENALYCVDGACKRIGDTIGHVGQACGYQDMCEDEADCVSGTCMARAQANESCATVGCVHTAACEANTHVCRPKRADGASCEDNQDCLGKCNPRKVCVPESSGAATQQRCSSADAN